MLREFFVRLWSQVRENRDYARGLGSQYAFMATHVAVQVLLVPLYLHSLGKFQFGVLMVLLGFINYSAIGINWMTGGALRVLGETVAHKDEEGFRRAYALSKWIYVGYGILLASLALLFVLVAPRQVVDGVPIEYQDSVEKSIILLGVYLILFYDLCVDRIALMATGKLYLANTLLIVALAGFAASAVPVLLRGGTLDEVVACLLVGIILARVGAWWIWRHLQVRIGWQVLTKESWPLVRRLAGRMGFGFFLYGAILLTMQADTIIVSTLGGVTLAAEFVLVWKIAEVVIQIIWRIPETFVPNFIELDAKTDTERLRSLNQASVRWSVAVSLVAGFVYAVAGPAIVELWVGPEHVPDKRIAYVLAGLVIALMGSSHTHAMFAYATLRLKELIRISGIELLVKLVLTVALFPLAGYSAPMIGLIAARLGGVQLAYSRLTRRALTA